MTAVSLKGLWGRKLRTALTALAIVLVVLLAVNNLPAFAGATRFFAPTFESVASPR